MYRLPSMTAARLRMTPLMAMKRMLILPVEYTTMFGPPAMGSMNAKDAAKVTVNRNCTWSKPLTCAVLAMMEPKVASVDMFETTSVTEQMTRVTTRMKPNSFMPASARHSAIHSASSDFRVPWAISMPPPKTNKISHLKPARTASQSRMYWGFGSGACVAHRSSPMIRRSEPGSLQPHGMKKRGSVNIRPIAPLFSSTATYFFQPGKSLILEAVNQRTMSSNRSSATTACSNVTFPSSAYIVLNSWRSTGIASLLRHTYATQKKTHTVTRSIADSGRAHKKNLAKENSPSDGQNFSKLSMKMPLVGVPTGVAMPPMVAL
mmetsp:Transcript_787/g.2601  ORF Transcript_787/g.2601 Transcript_787/m.2601 type:complete len:319 (-) Transcript_787:742-1698(-)